MEVDVVQQGDRRWGLAVDGFVMADGPDACVRVPRRRETPSSVGVRQRLRCHGGWACRTTASPPCIGYEAGDGPMGGVAAAEVQNPPAQWA